MCHSCHHTPCLPNCPTIQYVPCAQYPPAPGAQGLQGPQGPTGPAGPAPPVPETGQWSLVYNGTINVVTSISGTGAVLIGGTPGVTATIEVSTINELKLWFGLTLIPLSGPVYSDGKSNGILTNTSIAYDGNLSGGSDFLSINVFDPGGFGWTGTVSNVTPTTYRINLVAIGTLLQLTNVTIRNTWFGIMG